MSTVEKRRCDRCGIAWPSTMVTCSTGFVHGQCQRCARVTRQERQERGDIIINFPPGTDLRLVKCYHFPLRRSFIRRVQNRLGSLR